MRSLVHMLDINTASPQSPLPAGYVDGRSPPLGLMLPHSREQGSPIRDLYRASELCQRIGKIEGIGPVTATALIAAVGDRTCFKNGRQFAVWLGLVSKQQSSGGRTRLLGTSKRGDRYLRTLLIHGARAALGKADGKQDPRSLWLGKMRERRHPNVVAVALTNKNARIVWAMLASDETYKPEQSVQAA